jgi:hypothetical protein
MGTLAQSYFGQRIEECRELYDKGSLAFLRWFGLRIRPTYDGFDDIVPSLRPHYDILAKKGQVVWGSVAQVNMGMFFEGPIDLPGVSVYSTDPYYDENPQDLFAIGRACFQFKNTDPVDADFKPLAARLTDEFDGTVRMRLPNKLTEDREVYLAATMYHRSRLPGKMLRASLTPVVIAPDATEVNMVLQLPYWSETLRKSWDTLQDTLEGITIRSKAQQIAEDAEKLPAQTRPPNWDTQAVPIYLTPAMVDAYYVLIQPLHLDFFPYLYIGLDDMGGKRAELLIDYDRLTEMTFKSAGVLMAVRKDQVNRLRGAIVDYKDSVFSKGIVVRLPGE